MKRYQSLTMAAAVALLALSSATPHARHTDASPRLKAARSTPTQQREPAPDLQDLTPPERGVLPLAPNAIVRRDAETGQVRIIEGFIKVGGGSKTDAVKTAQLFVARKRELLVNPQTEFGQVRPVREIQPPAGTYVIFERYFNGLPVFDNEVKVTLTRASDTVNMLFSHMEEMKSVADTSATRSAGDAREIAIAAVRNDEEITDSVVEAHVQPGYVRVNEEVILVWKVNFDTREPLAAWEVLVEAASGRVFSVANVAAYGK